MFLQALIRQLWAEHKSHRMNSGDIQSIAQHLLSLYTGDTPVIQKVSPVGGGCINDAQRLETSAGTFFLKYNDAMRYPGMFAAEARGLQVLAQSGTLRLPRVIACAESDYMLVARHEGSQDRASGPRWGESSPETGSSKEETDSASRGKQDPFLSRSVPAELGAVSNSLLLLEYIEAAPRGKDFWDAFGSGLARMHKQKPVDGRYGLDHDNYIGSLHQSNRPRDTWADFFVTERLEVQLRMARDKGKAGRELTRQFEAFYRHLSDFFPEEPPSLLHGDLWSGNYMTGSGGEAVIIDPAVYYGHRYMDLGMSRLFGGFNQSFYRSYMDTYPMESNWEQSMDIANLYPLMVHVNLFGGGYIGSVKSILRRFS